MHPLTRLLRQAFVPLCAGLLLAACGSDDDNPTPPPPAKPVAGITKIVISSTESPTFESKTFGAVGAYEKLRGTAFGQLDPADPRNAVITDLSLAPRNADGMIEYAMDIYILKPVDLAKGNHKLFFEVNNRGGKLFFALNQSAAGNDPTTAADAGKAFLMNQGYTMAWSGWDPTVAAGNNGLTITLPVAKNPDGSSITGPLYTYNVFDNATTTALTMQYPAANTDTTQATLTVKDHLTDAPTTIPSTGWQYASDKSIQLLPAGTTFKQSSIYEFTYPAKDPLVTGIGFAATRDFISFLRHAKADTLGVANPLAGDVTRVLGYTVSQPGRYMNDYVWLGFNEDEFGGKVFDGVENWIAAGTGVSLNYRFSQDGNTERNRQYHLFPEGRFPFSYTSLSDTLTGKTDGRDTRCTASDTCPKIMSVNSANEYWVKTGSLVHTDTNGGDIADPANVRFYLLSGVEHTVTGDAPNSPGVCAQPRNTTDPSPALRAILVAMDQWIDGTEPPASMMPRNSDNTAVFMNTTADSPLGIGQVDQAALGWPNIPGVTYTGLVTVRNVYDFGAQFDAGILATQPPVATGKVYPAFVSKVDADGNEIAGVRLPPVAAPIGTTTGWGLRATAFGGPDGCESSGQFLAFPATQADRIATGDPRLSLSERYADHAAYVSAVTTAAQALADKRLLLPDDVALYTANAASAPIPTAVP